jgi:two-component system, OmpR family, sensor kinase
VFRALRSLRWRLTLTYVALLAVLLTALGAYSYFTLRASLISNRVASLQDDYNSARDLIARAAAGTTGVVRGRRLCAAAPALVGRSIATVVAQTTGHSIDVVVYDNALAVTATMPAGAALPQLDPTTLQRIVTTSTRSSGQVLPTPGGDDLVVGFPITVGTTSCGVAQLSTSMTPLNDVLHEELVLIVAGGAVALVLALLLGLVLTGRTLRPLDRLTVTAQQLAAGDLRARSRLVPRDDEVGALTQSFDNMADRIEDLFTAQQESEAQVRRFIADASHELRTPVTSLKGYIDVLRRGAGRDPETLDASLQAMSNEAERMRELVLDLLTLARIDARRELKVETLDLNAEVSQLLDEGVAGMPAALERQLAPAPLEVRADRSAIGTIVRNLLVNACKYATGAPQRWSTSVDGKRARLDVHDDGPGIPPADLPHVFERFYRGGNSRTREEGGSGLGLSIVQALARSLGGDVAVWSAEGHGTTVSVYLPLASP